MTEGSYDRMVVVPLGVELTGLWRMHVKGVEWQKRFGGAVESEINLCSL